VKYYEILMLLSPDTTQEACDEIKNKIKDTIENDFGGELKTFDKWGKYLLAYQIKNNSYGIYILVRFGVSDSKALKTLTDLFVFKYESTVLRNVFVKLTKNFSDSYYRPDSLEDAPKSDRAFNTTHSQSSETHRKKRQNLELAKEVGKADVDVSILEKDIVITESGG
jgi:small subunit ribosomal protein S6